MATPPVSLASAAQHHQERAGIEHFLVFRVLVGVFGDLFKM